MRVYRDEKKIQLPERKKKLKKILVYTYVWKCRSFLIYDFAFETTKWRNSVDVLRTPCGDYTRYKMSDLKLFAFYLVHDE